MAKEDRLYPRKQRSNVKYLEPDTNLLVDIDSIIAAVRSPVREKGV